MAIYQMDINQYIHIDSHGRKVLELRGLSLTELPENLPDDIDILDCAFNSLTHLPKLPLNLESLYCGNNQLTSLPELPDTLIGLYCGNNQLTSLPDLNNGLKLIILNVNQLTTLPKLPNTVAHIFCGNNRLTTLPELPDSLRSFICWNNPFIAPFNAFVLDYSISRNINRLRQDVNGYYAELKRKGRNLGSLMATLGRTELQGRMGLGNNNTPRNVNPNGSRKAANRIPMNALDLTGSFLTGLPGPVNNQRNALKRSRKNRRKQKGGDPISLDYSSQELISLPELPDTLIELYCGNNQLRVLPQLPPTLKLLDCGINKLTELPQLPPTLQSLSCVANDLTVLPQLSPNLKKLYCGNNKLTTLPEIPDTLIDLYCGNNQLTTLPELPNIRDLYCNGNQLRVLPKLPETLEILSCYSNQLRALPELPASLISIIFKIGEHSNPFIEPFKSFTDEYERTDNILDLRNNVNSYWAEQKAKGRNLGSLMATLGRTELQGRMGLGNANTPRNVNPNGSRRAVNRIPMNALDLTGSFLTGLSGPVNNQRNALKGNFKGGKKTRRTRKN